MHTQTPCREARQSKPKPDRVPWGHERADNSSSMAYATQRRMENAVQADPILGGCSSQSTYGYQTKAVVTRNTTGSLVCQTEACAGQER